MSQALPLTTDKRPSLIGDGRPSLAVFASTIFISAFLLFEVQPLIAKQILPWFGGSAAVWTTCMLFFQIALLLGYAYAHAAARFKKPQTQAWLHIALLGFSVLTLPIIPSAWWKPAGSDDPLFRILGLLGATIGLPYLLLSSTSPLLQSWLSKTYAGAVPYRLFALSNFGSMLALLSYPFLIEPRLTSGQQAWTWSAGYAAFALLCGWTGYRSRNTMAVSEAFDDTLTTAPRWKDYVLWLALAGSASALLLAVTNHLSQNVASIPFLWILPLALYLLSFILCFESSFWYRRILFLPLFPVALGLLALNLFNKLGEFPFRQQIAVFAGTLFVCCMVLHGELARIKPAARFLTGFYLMTAVGGAIGGLFVAFIAPRIFNAFYEFPISIVVCALAVLMVYYRDQPAGVAWKSPRQIAWLAGFAATVWLSVFLFHETRTVVKGAVLLVRNFYGALRVNDEPKSADQDALRELTHGTINHGEQFVDPVRRHEPTTYYGPRSGIGLLLRDLSIKGPLKVGVVGLGTGTIAAYGKPGDVYRYYEINPLVIDIAKHQFFYLADSPAKVETVLGDARLSMEREPVQNFDVLAVDAFSSDSIPVHLLTREAFAVYFRQLKPDGVLAIHISNRYLDLAPVVDQEARAFGKSVLQIDNESEDVGDISASSWVLVTGREGYVNRASLKSFSVPIAKRSDLRIWTDDYSNLWQIVK